MRDPIAYFHQHYKVDDSGCWLWTGYTSGGYGVFKRGQRQGVVRAHRLSLEIATGISPDGLNACHKCDVPLCVNPDHLFWGTTRDNARDASAKGRLTNKVNAAKTMCPRGHPYSPENTYLNPKGGRVCRTCNKVAKARWESEQRIRP